ncbi:MAG TPA: hypothetical protein PLL10_03000, partial [Elusimicrobiales bacterium]|nr:hypothetical protein [Elusimicrobiales bacterium]
NEGYSLESREFREVIKVIRDHGHQVGLHASHQSYDQPALVREEKARLEGKKWNNGFFSSHWELEFTRF